MSDKFKEEEDEEIKYIDDLLDDIEALHKRLSLSEYENRKLRIENEQLKSLLLQIKCICARHGMLFDLPH